MFEKLSRLFVILRSWVVVQESMFDALTVGCVWFNSWHIENVPVCVVVTAQQNFGWDACKRALVPIDQVYLVDDGGPPLWCAV